ncbi:F-box protein CPR1-like [Nicotiana tabacum]|uniref:F-box protein CPR1-like n=1 Tax=Nicotiana tabacum TaxID=4097 RepID=A0AC58SMF1_TOBAC
MGKMDTPCYGEGDFKFMPCLGVLGSVLSVLCDSRKTDTDVWVMNEYGVKESWTKMFTINYPVDRVGNMLVPPFCMSSEGRILFEDGSTS